MANEEDKGNDLYEVLGLNKECSRSELRNAYKKLALKWHPDRCSASVVEEAKNKFQAIQQAYSVLSDANKRFLYDVGVYDSDDDQNGMGDFMNEMATMMSQTKPSENGEESFEELQQLFKEIFQADNGSTSHTAASATTCSVSSTFVTCSENRWSSSKIPRREREYEEEVARDMSSVVQSRKSHRLMMFPLMTLAILAVVLRDEVGGMLDFVHYGKSLLQSW
ncbi:DnaJ domain containing protein [Sesbania bispinosa]|nr:DnaJ domain containing protein [Sesbania bispinosa]